MTQAASSHSARRSLLSRQAPQGGIQEHQQQQQPVVTPSAEVMSQQLPSQRLTAIPEAEEAPTAQEVPQGPQEDTTAGADTAARQGGAALSTFPVPADAGPAAAVTDFEEGAATGQQYPIAEQLELLAGPRATISTHDQPKYTVGPRSSSERMPHRGSYHVQPATAPTAVLEGTTQGAAPLTLGQLAAAPAPQQLESRGHSAAQAGRHAPRPAAQQAMPPTQVSGAVEARLRQDASSSGPDILQSLQASLVQTVTAAVESAMTQVRWGPADQVLLCVL